MTNFAHCVEPVDMARPLHVLVWVEDDVLRDCVLLPRLQEFGFFASTAGRLCELASAMRKKPDMVLMDIDALGDDGLSVSHRLREKRAEIGIVMLSGQANSAQHVRCLVQGADAYLSKPVDVPILVATLYCIARRMRLSGLIKSGFGKWKIGPDGWLLISPQGQRVRLSANERKLIELFVRNVDMVLSRDHLIGALTADVQDFDPHRLDSLVHRLRRKVLVETGELLPVVAVRGAGYVLSHK